jgi:hypothetical protein
MGQEELTDLNPPPEVVALRQPERVFRQTGASRKDAWLSFCLFGVPSALIGLLLVSMPVTVLFIKEQDRAKIVPLMLLVPPLFSFFFFAVAGFLYVQVANAGRLPVYAIYPTALAIWRDGEWSVVGWDEVSEVLPHGLFRWYPALRFPDGRTQVLRYKIENPWFLSLAIEKAFRAAQDGTDLPLSHTPAASPTRRMVSATPANTTPVPRYRGTADSVPPEVLALGSAENIHKPAPLLLFARDNPAAAIGVGLLVIAAAMGPLVFGVVNSIYVVMGLFVLVLGGGLFAMLPFLSKGIPTFLVFKDALVEVKGDEFAVLRWDEIKELNPPRIVVTNDGQQFDLNGMVQDLGRLYNAVHSRLRARLIPQVTAALKAGQPVSFGEFTLSPMSISYGAKTLSWGQVTSMQVSVYRGSRSLNIWDGHILPWCIASLSEVPNDWLFLEAVKIVCPPHLLAPRA